MRHDHFSMLPERAFRSLGGRMTLEGGGKGSAPPAPDYTGAAQSQAQSSKETTNMANYANRPTINTPYGGQSWQTEAVTDPATGQQVTKWTQNTTLTPASQKALDSQMAMQQGRSDIANSLMPTVQEAITKPIDYNSFSKPGDAPTASNFQGMGNAPQLNTNFQQNTPTYDKAYVQDLQNQALDYMRPDQEHQQGQLQAKLANQGITPGSEAYNTAMRQMNDQQARDKYQALNTAMQQGSQMYNNQLAGNAQNMQALNFGNSAMSQQQGLDQNVLQFNNTNLQNQFAQQQNIANYQNTLRQQQISEAQQRQLQPLNNINALISGQQVSMPSMPSFNANQAAQPVNYLGAAQAQGNYAMQNQQMANASQSSTIGGIGSLLGTAAGAAMMMSDRRLKRDIKLIKMITIGKKALGWYSYRYAGQTERHEGVMANEVKKINPKAVKRHHSGYDMVDYAMIGA